MAAESAANAALDAVEELKAEVGGFGSGAAAGAEPRVKAAVAVYKRAHDAWEAQDEYIDNALRPRRLRKGAREVPEQASDPGRG